MHARRGFALVVVALTVTASPALAGPLSLVTVPLALAQLAPPAWSPADRLSVVVPIVRDGYVATVVIHAATREVADVIQARLGQRLARVLVNCGTCDGDWSTSSMMAGANSAIDAFCVAMGAALQAGGVVNVWVDAFGALCASFAVTQLLWDGGRAIFAAYMWQASVRDVPRFTVAMLGYCGGYAAC